MPKFIHNSRFSGGSSKPFRRDDRRSFDAPREMFDARCGKCGDMTQVPFRPNGKKPIFCRNCFTPDTDRGSRDRFPKRDSRPERAPFARPVADPRIDEILRELKNLRQSVEALTAISERSERATLLTAEVQKHVPATKPKKTPVKKKSSKK